MKTVQCLCVLMLSLCLMCLCAHAEDSPEKLAQIAAETWLGQVDMGNDAESWRAASPYFQGAVTESAWVESLHGVRKPLGKVLSRNLKSAQHTQSVPGAPDGNYIVMLFDTSFENKQTAVETVTFMQEKDHIPSDFVVNQWFSDVTGCEFF